MPPRPEERPAAGAEEIRDAARERRLGTDDGQIDTLVLGKVEDCVRISYVDRDRSEGAGDAGIARRAHHGIDSRLAGKSPAQGVLAGAAAHDQDSHLTNREEKG
jgi:hypothetical protein